MKIQMLLTALIFAAVPAQAKTGSEAGFDRLKDNIENSKANLDDYKKNLGIVEGNLKEVGKARATAEDQRKQVAGTLKENAGALEKFNKQEKEIGTLMADEKSKIAAEEKKLAELEALIARIKENRGKREANLQNYQQQLTTLQGERKAWQIRGEALAQQDGQAKARVKELQALENEQKNKKKGYEGEIGRWSKEVEKQTKNLQQFQALADSK